MSKLVSILVPIYNVEKHIRLCLYSLFEQSYSNIEYVFVNDCTPDRSIDILYEILAMYPERRMHVKIINHDTNKGIAYVRNTLLTNATGEYIYFVDSDDWIEKDTIECFCIKSAECQAEVIAADYYISHKNEEERVSIQYASNSIGCLRQLLAMEIKPVLWLLFVKRSLFLENNLLFQCGIDVGEDYIVCAKIYSFAKSVASIERPFYHYVIYNEQSYSTNTLKFRRDTFLAINAVEDFLINIECYEDVIDAINLRKFVFKIRFILETPYDINQYLNTFPEVELMWRSYIQSRRQRFFFWLIEKRHLKLVKFFIWLKKEIKY